MFLLHKPSGTKFPVLIKEKRDSLFAIEDKHMYFLSFGRDCPRSFEKLRELFSWGTISESSPVFQPLKYDEVVYVHKDLIKANPLGNIYYPAPGSHFADHTWYARVTVDHKKSPFSVFQVTNNTDGLSMLEEE
jgi:hypothetical protein